MSELKQAQRRLIRAIALSKAKITQDGEFYRVSQRSQTIDIYLANNASQYKSSDIA